jgi:hypothetical protein
MTLFTFRTMALFAASLGICHAAAPGFRWEPVGKGDCPGRDVSGGAESSPDPSKCNSAFSGLTAVCWGNGCTYKNVPTASCTGGANPGNMYTCRQTSPGTSVGNWRPVGTGDCPGRDVAGSTGPNPDASKCTAGFGGYTAVCWNGNCTYKNLPTGSCTGGANPGRMYTCDASTGAVIPAPQPAVKSYRWESAGRGDCPGRDVSGGAESSPDASKCTASFAGFTAVCWGTGCTYKNVATRSCTGGANPGNMYTCREASGNASSVWRSVGTGDCPGRDVAGSTGPNPDASKCTAAFRGYTAVCWNGTCTYKNLAAGSCTGGANPGRMYVCDPGR